MTENKRGIGSDLAKVDAYQNTAADYNELPELDDTFFAEAKAEVGGKPMGRPPIGDRAKKQLTLRLDEVAIDRFKATGPGWQGRMNDVLVEASKKLKRA